MAGRRQMRKRKRKGGDHAPGIAADPRDRDEALAHLDKLLRSLRIQQTKEAS